MRTLHIILAASTCALLLVAGCSGDNNNNGAGGSGAVGAGGSGGSPTGSGGDMSGNGGAGGGANNLRTVSFENKCAYTVWAGALNGDPKYELPANGGWKLDPGQKFDVTVSTEWAGRFWGRTGCTFDASGKGACATADCGGKLACSGSGGKPPATLAEFKFGGFGGKDFYDISLVDGYNLPMGVAPKPGTFTVSDPNDMYDCGSPGCTSDLNATCPPDLQKTDASGKVIACLSACEKYGTDAYCCKGANNTPDTCPPTNYSMIFKTACPTAYSYAYDDKTSTFTCKGRDYIITFCP
jgi:hypothetical protein